MKLSSSFVSLIARKSTLFLQRISWRCINLYRKLFMLTCNRMKFDLNFDLKSVTSLKMSVFSSCDFTLRSTQFSFEYGLWWPVTLEISPGVRHVDMKTQNSASLTFVRGLHRWPVDSPYGFPLKRTRYVENVSIWWHHSALCFHPGDRNVFGICSSSI